MIHDAGSVGVDTVKEQVLKAPARHLREHLRESLGCQLAVREGTFVRSHRTAIRNLNLICAEATTGFEPVIAVLQTAALPLGYVAGTGGF